MVACLKRLTCIQVRFLNVCVNTRYAERFLAQWHTVMPSRVLQLLRNQTSLQMNNNCLFS